MDGEEGKWEVGETQKDDRKIVVCKINEKNTN